MIFIVSALNIHVYVAVLGLSCSVFPQAVTRNRFLSEKSEVTEENHSFFCWCIFNPSWGAVTTVTRPTYFSILCDKTDRCEFTRYVNGVAAHAACPNLSVLGGKCYTLLLARHHVKFTDSQLLRTVHFLHIIYLDCLFYVCPGETLSDALSKQRHFRAS